MVRLLSTEGRVSGCQMAGGQYGTIAEILSNQHWADLVTGLAVIGGSSLVVAPAGTRVLQVMAITPQGSFMVDPSELTFSATGVSVAPDGTVTGVVGGGTVNIVITARPTIDISVIITDA